MSAAPPSFCDGLLMLGQHRALCLPHLHHFVIGPALCSCLVSIEPCLLLVPMYLLFAMACSAHAFGQHRACEPANSSSFHKSIIFDSNTTAHSVAAEARLRDPTPRPSRASDARSGMPPALLRNICCPPVQALKRLPPARAIRHPPVPSAVAHESRLLVDCLTGVPHDVEP